MLGALRVRKHRVSQLSDDDDDSDISTQSNRDSLYEEEVALGGLFFGLGNIHMQLGDHAQAMQNFIESRDMRWRHVGGGSTDKILDRYLSGSSVDEDELLGLGKYLRLSATSFSRFFASVNPHSVVFAARHQHIASTILVFCLT